MKVLILDLDGSVNVEYPSKVINKNIEVVKKDPYGSAVWDLFESSTKNMKAKPQFLPYYYSSCFRERFEKIYIITARLDKWKPQTERWLKKWGIHYDEIFLRPLELMTLPSHEVKEIIIKKHILPKYNPKDIVACDDELGICNMYRSYGINVYQVPVDWSDLITDLNIKYPKLKQNQKSLLEYYLVKEYRKGKTLKEVAIELGYNYRSLVAMKKILNNKVLNSRTTKRYKRIDIEGFKKLDTEIAAYVAGFAAAAGTVELKGNSASLSWEINSKNEEVLENIKSALKAEQKIIRQTDHTFFSIKQISLINLLVYRWGITQNKHSTLKFPKNIPKETINHFLRGVFDGCGYFHISSKKSSAQFMAYSGSLEFITGISKILLSFGISTKVSRDKKDIPDPLHRIIIGDKYIKGLYELLYSNSTLFFKRQKLDLEKYLNMFKGN